jgi:hypothetical protein
MNQLVPITAHAAPALVVAAGDRAQTRFWEFFVSNIRNPHTVRAMAGLCINASPGAVREARCGREPGDRCAGPDAAQAAKGRQKPSAPSMRSPVQPEAEPSVPVRR